MTDSRTVGGAQRAPLDPHRVRPDRGSPTPATSREDTIPDSLFAKPHCLLFFPGTRPDMYDKAIATGADHVCMDLEDAVAPDAKDDARASALSLLAREDLDAERFVLRVNRPQSVEGDRDLEALGQLDVLRERPVKLMVPKADSPDELAGVRRSLVGRGVFDSFIAVIESARGLARVEDIAAAPPVSGLLFGGLDLSVDLGAALDWDALLYARSRVVHAARLGGIGALDMPFLKVADSNGLRREAEATARLGFVGKAAIHPGQVEVIHDAFSPTAAEVERARKVKEAFARSGEGVFLLDGVMVDRPEIESARRIAEWADARGR